MYENYNGTAWTEVNDLNTDRRFFRRIWDYKHLVFAGGSSRSHYRSKNLGMEQVGQNLMI
jgi:hypothetical protein